MKLKLSNVIRYSFFSKLYSEDNIMPQQYHIWGCFPVIDAESLSFLQGPLDETEIKNIIFSMNPLKALGIDGLHAIFLPISMGCGCAFFLLIY